VELRNVPHGLIRFFVRPIGLDLERAQTSLDDRNTGAQRLDALEPVVNAVEPLIDALESIFQLPGQLPKPLVNSLQVTVALRSHEHARK
jgi:hypothetical protein